MADQEEDFSHIPLTERAVHKNWKVRKAAYEEAAAGFAKTPDESDAYFFPWFDGELWKKIVSDSNVAAQQEGISALCAFLKFGGEAACTRTRSAAVGPLVEKGLASTRAATKANALEALLLYVELDVPGPVIQDLLPFMSHKMPKLVTATVNAIAQIFQAYGARTCDPKPVLKVLPKLFGHADKNVRGETTALCVELYKWLKDAIKPMFFNDLKLVQQKELEDAFEKVKDEGPKQQRLLRSQQAAQAAAEAAGAVDDGEVEEDAAPIDAYDLAEPVSLTPKLTKEFYDATGSTKWKERKDALDDLYAAANAPRIREEDFNELIKVLAKSMKDANIAVVTVAANVIDVLAKGLRKCFAKYKSAVLAPILERMKEKKQTVVDALAGALDSVFNATSLTDCLEEIVEFLKHKNPQVKLETLRFLIRCLKNTRVAPTKPETKSIVDAVTKLLGDTAEPVRTGSAEAMGTLMKIMGERAMNPYMDGLDDIRKARIKEFFETAVVKAKDKPVPPPPPPGAKGPVKKAPGKSAAKQGGGGPKKPAAPAAAPLRQASPPPEPTPAPPKAISSKLAAPKSGLGGLRLQKKAAASAPRVATPPSPVEEPAPPAPPKFLGRGPSSRPLSNPQQQAPPLQPVKALDPGLTAAEKAELEELREGKEKLWRQIADDKAEKAKLLQEINDLQLRNAQLIEEHTHDNLALRAKDAQLIRTRADVEQAEANNQKLQREIDRLKRELSRTVRASSPAPTDISDNVYRDSMISNYGPAGSLGHPGIESLNSRNSKRLSFASTFSEEKENGYERQKVVSPTIPTMAAATEGRNSPSRHAAADNVESWKRAAEVTNQLKMRIEQMKRQNGIGRQ